MAVFSMKIPALEAVDRQKKRKLVQCGRVPGMSERVQLVRLVPGCWRMLPGVIVSDWYNLTQRVLLIRFWWCFLSADRVKLYRCFCVPRDGDGLRAGTGTDGGMAGGQREAVPPYRLRGSGR